MGILLGADHALAPTTGRQARLRGPPRFSTSSEPGNHPNPGPDPATRLLLGEPFARAGGQVERGSSVAQVSQAILRTAVR